MRLRIVVADDHPVVRLGASAIIAKSGIGDVVGEANGTDSLLALLSQVACDVLVTDFTMPGGNHPDGLALLSAVRRRHPDLPIVLLSTMSNPSLLRLAMESGAQALVDKAATSLDELPTAILTVRRGQTYVSSGIRQLISALDEVTSRQSPSLSPRETEVLRLLANGMSVSGIAAQLNRSITTISHQKNSAMRKLGITNEADLFSFLQAQQLR